MPASAPIRRLAATAALAFALAACATPGQQATDAEVYDPAESVNRGVFAFNEGVDTVVLRPAAQAYRATLPQFVQDSVQTLVRTVTAPVVLANDLLQGDIEGAAETSSRFMVNVAMGLGVFDVASQAGIPYHSEDFGQTLAVWGVGDGPYLVLPLFGPSNGRDAAGRVVDTLGDPFRAVAINRGAAPAAYYGIYGTGTVDQRARLLDATEDLKRNSLDYYATVRSLYRQNRQNLISNGKSATESP